MKDTDVLLVGASNVTRHVQHADGMKVVRAGNAIVYAQGERQRLSGHELQGRFMTAAMLAVRGNGHRRGRFSPNISPKGWKKAASYGIKVVQSIVYA